MENWLDFEREQNRLEKSQYNTWEVVNASIIWFVDNVGWLLNQRWILNEQVLSTHWFSQIDGENIMQDFWSWKNIKDTKLILWLDDDEWTQYLTEYIGISQKNNEVVTDLIFSQRTKLEIIEIIGTLTSLFGNDLSKSSEWVDNFFRWVTVQ